LALNKVALITTSIALFGLALRPVGFGPALLLLVLVSAYASRRFRWPVAATLAVGLAVFSVIAFVKLLGLPIAVFGSWLGG
jgi:hypothetical protein